MYVHPFVNCNWTTIQGIFIERCIREFHWIFPCIQILVKIGQCQTLYVKAFSFAFSVKSSFNKSECKHVIDFHSLQLGTQRSRVILQRLTPNVTCDALLQECFHLRNLQAKLPVPCNTWTNVIGLSFLGAFAKLLKATISYVMSVLLSNCMKQLGSHWTYFQELSYLTILRKYVEKILTNGYFTWRPIYTLDIPLNSS